MKSVLHVLTFTVAIAICAAPAVLAQSSAEGEAEAMSETPHTRNVAVPGASIYVEQRGSGPTLLLIPGGPQDAGVFAALASELSDQFTVISLDPRCNSRSVCDNMGSDLNVDQHADDAAAVIAASGSDIGALRLSGPAARGPFYETKPRDCGADQGRSCVMRRVRLPLRRCR